MFTIELTSEEVELFKYLIVYSDCIYCSDDENVARRIMDKLKRGESAEQTDKQDATC